MAITLKSHGFKFGRPNANIYIDVSYFQNPWREKEIAEEKNKEKRKEKIFDFMVGQEGCSEVLLGTISLISAYHKIYPEENFQVALCCSAGEFRSPAMVELLSKMLNSRKIEHRIEHSEYSKI